MDKIVQTVSSRKALALALAFVLVLLNRILGWGMETGDILVLIAPLFTWAGIEGIMDWAKIRNGTKPETEPKKDDGENAP